MSFYHAACQGYHGTVSDARRCQGVGYGGESLPPARSPEKAATVMTGVPATASQVRYIRTLSGERTVPVAGKSHEEANLLERLFDLSGWRGEEFDPEHDKFVSKKEASALITYLQKLPRVEAPKSESKPEVPAGRYALPGTDGLVRFYKVDRPTEGRWKGYTFVKLLLGAPGHWREERINRSVESSVLATIAKDPEGQARLFGRKTRTCGHCSSPLSDPQSRVAGYGETCAGNHGYWYPTKAEALEMLGEMADVK